MQNNFLRGTGVALITPFDINGNIDFKSLENIIHHVSQGGGVDYLVTMGSTGEAATLSLSERQEIIRFTVSINAGKLPIVVGIGGNNTREVAEEIKQLDTSGITAILSSSPAYNKPTQEGIFQHYMQLAEVSSLPIIIYNVPGRTSSNILAETTIRLAKASSKFIAIKEASGDIAQATKIIKDRPSHFYVVSGDDPLALALIGVGGDGVISVIANAYPKEFAECMRNALNGNYNTAQQQNLNLFDIHKWLYIEGNPAGIKAACTQLGLCQAHVRLPLVAMSDANVTHLASQMQALKMIA